MAICSICCDKFTDVVRKQIGCSYCEFVACMNCVKQYLLSISNDPSCMNCKVGWTFEFLESKLPPTWIKKKYHLHRQNVLFERQLAQMPATQPLVEREIEKRRLTKLNKKLIKKKLAAKNMWMKGEMEYQVYWDTCKQYDDTIYQNYQRIRDLEYAPKPEPTKYKYVRACPADGCKGFLNENWKCGLCDTDVCSKCHVVKKEDETHKCKPEDVETAKLLSKDSKPCPSCSAMIFKIDGCDQMFCTQCHTAFSWKTGVIESNNIHNPHYYEWVRQNNNGVVPRNPPAAPINACNNARMFEDARTFQGFGRRISHIHRLLMHIRYVEIPNIRASATNDPFQDLRIKYMLNDITVDDYKKKLANTENARRRKHSIWHILDMFYNTGMDMLRSLHDGTITKKEVRNQVNELISYVNQSLEAIGKQHKCKIPIIDAAAYDMIESLSRYYTNRKKREEAEALENAMAGLTV